MVHRRKGRILFIAYIDPYKNKLNHFRNIGIFVNIICFDFEKNNAPPSAFYVP